MAFVVIARTLGPIGVLTVLHASGPKIFCLRDMPNARIFTFGYDADIAQLFHSVSVANLDQHAQGLCAQLSDRADCDQVGSTLR